MNNKIIYYLKKIIPYIILLVFSLISSSLLFYKGISHGDDYRFHIPNIIEEYETLLMGKSLSPISGILGMGVGTGTRLFYSPLPHLLVTILALFLRLYNGSIILAYKIVLFASIYLSGIFMYHFTKKFTKNNEVAAILASCFYIIYPYRLFDYFHRFAFAEGLAMAFLPLFFMGLYDLVSLKDKITIKPFLEIIFGGSLLFLSHSLTGFYTFIFGIIYLLFNIKKIVYLIKSSKRFLSFSILSFMILLGIISINFFGSLELMSLKIYNINDYPRMWSDVDSVVSQTYNLFDASGFIFLPTFLGKYQGVLSISKYFIESFVFIILLVIFIIFNECLFKLVSKRKLLYSFISLAFLTLVVFIFKFRIEIKLALAIFAILYYVIYFVKENNKPDGDKIYHNNLFWYASCSIVILLIMMSCGFVWRLLPQIMLNIQFPWRLWALFQLMGAILCGLLVYYFSFKKIFNFLLIVLLGFFMTFNYPLFEKRIEYEIGSWHEEIDYKLLDASTSLGFNKEYLPQVLFDDDYKSNYKNSLYNAIAFHIYRDTDDVVDYSYKPVVLEGNANINILSCFAPKYEMEISVTEKTLIQMPLIYYPGYQILANDKNVEVYNVDGLIAFYLDEGTYNVKTNYIGTIVRRISYVYFTLSLITLGVFISYYIISEKRRSKNASKKS